MQAADSVRIVVTDTSVVINLLHVGRLAIFSSLRKYAFVITDEVLAEVTDPEQGVALRQAIDGGHLSVESLAAPAELQLFAEHVQVLGKGEASCLALAEVRGYLLACDERRRFRTMAQERLGHARIVNTPGLYVLAIRAGALTCEEADADKAVLESRRFTMKFTSFRDVVGEGSLKKEEEDGNT